MQKTLKIPVTIRGRGLHTNKDVIMKISPAPAFFGRRFIRTDLENPSSIKVSFENVLNIPLCTAIGSDKAKVLTIEHFMAACMALGLDNLLIEIDGEELPALDGSALGFYDELKKGGQVQQENRTYLELKESIIINDGLAYLVALPAEELRLSYTFLSNQENIPDMYYNFSEAQDDFETELAPARTIAFKEQLEELRLRGLALGGDESMVVLIDKTGFANNRRFLNEAARHKLLDLYGDLALIGEYRLKAHIIAVGTGHRHNFMLTRKIVKQMDLSDK
ncbi:MAG: UDP-3-O-acyl-N-acetylglucosamine deacetylase [Firmicutes bacterium]|nr:UDP-3-O-acyl-N-acetylglucosamine deacetylase [Bacillota bacterium]MDD4263279.1 UDP-3-O-acyl-N-acetylglucosamine deacetylase [Bacillota bacterium]MDD4693160.1 UDP-3-O-acyl-N-acetylglucosamine deacetylase [Bacillota bacterium]